MKKITTAEELRAEVSSKDCFVDITDDLYFSSKIGVSHSDLTKIFPPNEPDDFKRAMEHPKEKSKAMDFGSAVHLAVFQQEIFDEKVVIEPTVNKRTNAGKAEYAEFLESAGDKIILTQDELEGCYRIMEKIQQHPVFGKILQSGIGIPEVAGYFKRNGTQYRFKSDMISFKANFIFELKTTLAGHEWAYAKTISERHYDSQMAMYSTGTMQILDLDELPRFVWIAVEKTPPYKIYLWEAGTDWFKVGLQKLYEGMDTYEHCLRKNHWPSVTTDIREINPPKYLVKDLI